MSKKIACILLACLFSYFYAAGQLSDSSFIKKQHLMLSASCGYGNVLPSNLFVKGDNLKGEPINKYQFYSFKILWQNPGYRTWQKIYRAPYYGIGFSMGNFYDAREIGYPISCYGVLGIPVKRWEKAEWFTEMQFGLATNWHPYDSIKNPKNMVIGGIFTVHLDVAQKFIYHLSPKLDIGAGISFIHFSNGGFERPNHGFNIYSPYVELKYRFQKTPDYKNIEKPQWLSRFNSLFFMTGYGDHQLPEHELGDNYFGVIGLSVIYLNQLSNCFRMGTGVDMNYWMGLTANPDGTMGSRTFKNLTAGITLQPEFMIGKLSIVAGYGIYARHLRFGNFKQTYQRLGLRYDVYKNISLGVNIRAVDFMNAEFFEFNLGYAIHWKKK